MSSILKVDTIQTAAGGIPTAADLGLNVSGSVLQVVQNVHTLQTATTGTTYIDFPLSVNITPASTSSKVLVLLNYTGGIFSDNHLRVRLLRDTTEIEETVSGFFAQTAGASGGGLSMCILDSPSTTSQVTYKAQFRSRDSGEQVQVQYGNAPSSLTLMEIAG